MNSFYHSTRSKLDSVTSKQAILRGIAPDGGLYVADWLGQTKMDLAAVCAQDFHQTARQVLGILLPDYAEGELAACVEAAYGRQWDTPAVTPVTPLGADWLLELYHGPTSAFKDVALQMLPQLMSVARAGDGRDVMIVTATSGDTGKAALDGFAGVPHTGVTVFYPEGKVSDVQHLQMTTQAGDNVAVCAIRGNFDDAQSEVKSIFADEALAQRLAASGVALSSANSINVGRLAPQVTYYFDAYAQLVRAGAVKLGEKVTFCVPTGNFGDVLAGYYAKLLGLPVARLVVASNKNDVLTDFITTGTYDRRRDFAKTISPSMDILVSSNLERLLYHMAGADRVRGWMKQLSEDGSYRVDPEVMERIRADFGAASADDATAAAQIRELFEQRGYLCDPHTAVAFSAARRNKSEAPMVVLSTASPFKFPRDVLAALGRPLPRDEFAAMGTLAEYTGQPAPKALACLRSLPERFDAVIAPDALRDVVLGE